MDALRQYFPFLIPVAVLEVGLMVGALVHLLRRMKTRNLNVGAWAVIIVVFEIIGPVLYFLIGREED
ncbi:MAG: PLDc N-terminal domain-containing protein [Clostridia bacterium]|nr:PLDc N-terminal domain-containing protein [Clostridia bacterium]MDR3644307.1 PLDc N-terminal domain-containing protein [Clostridia bacterium]